MAATEPPQSPPVAVYALPTGHLYLPDRWLFENGSEDFKHHRQLVPDFSFLIRHSSGKNVLFDLGMRKVLFSPLSLLCLCEIRLQEIQDIKNHPRVIAMFEHHLIEPQVPQDSFDVLKSGPVQPEAIDAIIYSHLHFDHTGDCRKFPDAEVIVGPGSGAAAAPGWPEAPNSPFSSEPFLHPRFRELSSSSDEWSIVQGGFHCHDYFGDGSFFLVDTPGHMPGHLGGLARTGQDEWVFFGGDCCHHRALLTGNRPMSVTVGPGGGKSFHKDPTAAKNTIEKVRELEAGGEVLVALAHDALLEGRMPLYPEQLNGWKGSEWKSDLDEAVASM